MMLMLGSCALEDPGAFQREANAGDVSSLEPPAGATTCTAVRLTEPTAGFVAGIGYPITLSAVATCPAGVTPEFEYWAKPQGAENWTALGSYVPGSSTWALPWLGTWYLSVVARVAGATEGYQVRSSAVSGTAIHINRDPIAGPDELVTTLNAPGEVDVILNDSDPDNDSLTLTGHTDPLHGTVALSGRIATYTPDTGYLGLDSFTYSLSDGYGGIATGVVSVEIIDQPPVAADDVLLATSDSPGTTNVLANDTDPDHDSLVVTSFTQGTHGSVAFTGGVATYTAATSYVGSDSFTYTIDDGHGMTASAAVNVTVSPPEPSCAISISGPATAVYGQSLHLVATAQCNTGAAEVQWYHKIGSSYVIVQAYSTSLTLDYSADLVASSLFYAFVRVQGSFPSMGTSNTLSIKVADNTPQCTSVRMVTPSNQTTLHVGLSQMLTAMATCSAESIPEYQFWIKPSGMSNWTILPGYTTSSSSWTPPSTGSWAIKAAVRTTGSHVAYQISSGSVTVNVIP